MARNPKNFDGGTPMTHSGKLDKSGGTHWSAPTSNGERSFSGPTPYNHSKPIPRSSKANLGAPNAMSSDRSEMASSMTMPSAIKKSKPGVAAEPVKWHKSGRYNMSVPATDSEGAKISAKMKAR